jgi:hypothetical protein
MYPQLTAPLSLLFIASLFAGCTETPPVKEADTKSVQEVAHEAMNSKGKLSKEQINALITANAACRPNDKH